MKSQNFFPSVGANGPCQVHVNFGQLGFVFIEANVKKWGLAPMTGSLAPPPPYGSEQGSILLEGGREGVREGMGGYIAAGFQGHGRSSSQQMRLGRHQPTSPGPQRSPTDISLAQLSLVDSNEDVGEGTSGAATTNVQQQHQHHGLGFEHYDAPPDYESPEGSPQQRQRRMSDELGDWHENVPLIQTPEPPEPPIPSYDAVVAERLGNRDRSDTRASRDSRRSSRR
jgi:hypothetical protein